jgi:hypothetical protein
MSTRPARLLILLVLALPCAVDAATFAVDTTVDDPALSACDDAAPDDCSLRGAIVAANGLPLSEASTIHVPAGTYALSQETSCTFSVQPSPGTFFTLSHVPLCVSKQVTIQGAGADTTIIDGEGRGRVLFVSASAVAELRGVTIANGLGDRTFGNPALIALPHGGGILNEGTLTLTDSVVRNSSVPAGAVNGGAIFNNAVLTLQRSAVSDNVSPGGQLGGGIFNQAAAVLSLSDSTISNNVIGGSGGGIGNNGGVVTITNSTVSGNTAGGSGGRIASSDAVPFTAMLTVVNSTISGNTCGGAGGGIGTSGGVADLNNVTITNNTGATVAGSGGGVSIHVAQFTLRNTVIAGNRDLSTGSFPDCTGALISRGYNLIQDTTGCIITGDLTGNIVGQDAKLFPLGDYGGPTETHALLAGSPAIDAGNPAAPGSGSFACTAIDQRGFNRLQDGDGDGTARCEIGAVELTESSGELSLLSIRPDTGGNSGSVTALVYGSGFLPGATVTLTRAGQADIAGNPVQGDVGGWAIAATFDLAGRSSGPWDVVVMNPDGTSKTLAAGFAIEAGRAPEPWVDITSPQFIRSGRPTRVVISFGNRGNVDALAVPLWLSTSSGYGLKVSFDVIPPPFQPNQVPTNWSQIPLTVEADAQGSFTNVPLLLPVVPAGFSGTMQIAILSPGDVSSSLFASMDPPYFNPTLDPQLISGFVEGARTYMQQNYAITIPATLVPDLEQYVTNQLQHVVDDSRNAFVASGGTAPQVYGLSQLQLDAAIFGARRALTTSPGIAQPQATHSWLATAHHYFVSSLSQLGLSEAWAQGQNCPVVLPCSMAGPMGGGCTCASNDRDVRLPPPVPIPPGCDPKEVTEKLKTPGGVFEVLGNAPECKITPANCEALPNTKIVNLADGTSVCAPTDCGKTYKLPSGGKVTPKCRSLPIRPRTSFDPNEKAGPSGATAAHFVLGESPLVYTVQFENLETATASAQEVVVTDQLDVQTMDLDTLSLGPISFGGDTTPVPAPGVQQYTAGVDLRPDENLIVTIVAGLDKATGVLTWRFTSIDPTTGQFTEDPAAGFLPPNVTPPEGEGSVVFTVQPKPGLATDTQICNHATIVFDVNTAIETPEWCNRIDVDSPVSAVDPMVAGCSGGLSLHWSGSDAGAGLDTFTIYVSEDGAPPIAWLTDTTETSGVYPGQPGKTYAFHSIAIDNVGNVEGPPASPDVVVTPAMGCCTTSIECADGNLCNGDETCNGATGGCIAGAPPVCPDDGDPCTTGSCVPATGCTQTPISPCPAACAVECPDDDPCTAEECVDGICARPEVTGPAGARCVCERPPADACEGQSVPAKVGKKTAAACRVLDRAVAATKSKRRRKLLKKASRAWGAAGRLLGKPAVTRALSPECLDALETTFADAASRALRAATVP